MHELRIMRARFAVDERGASAVEYGLLIAGIAALIVVVVFAFGGGSTGLFQDSCKTSSRTTALGPVPAADPTDPFAPRKPTLPGGLCFQRQFRQPFGERDPLQRGRVAAEPELRPGVRRRIGERRERQLLLQLDERFRVVGRPQRVHVRAGLDPPADAVLDRADEQGGHRQQRKHPGHLAAGRATPPPTTRPSSPTPTRAPAAPSSEPVSTSSWRAWPSSWATTESTSARPRRRPGCRRRPPAATSRSRTRRRSAWSYAATRRRPARRPPARPPGRRARGSGCAAGRRAAARSG